MEKTNCIQLKRFSDEHVKELSVFELPENQAKFTSLPNRFDESIEGQHGIVILNDNKPVGFFILHSTERVKEYSDNPKAMLLTSLTINYVHQGKGYAKQSMFILNQFVSSKFTNCDEIVLAVNDKNIAAYQLYLKARFTDTGKRKIGPIGEQFIMSLAL